MNMTIEISILLLVLFLEGLLFTVSGFKKERSENTTMFECGFTSYFFSRFSYSIHYFMVALIFLFLDLELCILMPFMKEKMESMVKPLAMWSIALLLLMGLIKEWKDNKLDWIF